MENKEFHKNTKSDATRIVVVNTVDFTKNGISSVIINYYKYINNKQLQLDIVVNGELDKDYEELFHKGNSQIYRCNRKKDPVKYFCQIMKILIKGGYDGIHVHGNSATMAVELLAARMAGCKLRIAHCHNSKCDHERLHKLLIPIFKKCYTTALACSENAGNWIFGEGKFHILPNGIEVEKYQYSDEIRKSIRDELNLNGKFVIGHIGFMNEQKNHEKLFGILYELRKKKANAHLLCVTGDESVPNKLRKIMSDYQLEQHITILHQRNDVNLLLQAMDFFVFPSKWEGFGIALLEAQASGLPCLVSNVVPKEVNLTGNVTYYSLKRDNKDWAGFINRCELSDTALRQKENEFVKKTEYNIRKSKEIVEKLYKGK